MSFLKKIDFQLFPGISKKKMPTIEAPDKAALASMKKRTDDNVQRIEEISAELNGERGWMICIEKAPDPEKKAGSDAGHNLCPLPDNNGT